jgi:aromatic ring hydroxylase
MVIFDDVSATVFIYRDVAISNNLHRHIDVFGPSAQQYVVKDLAKAEFMMALGFALARATKVDEFQHIQNALAELINHTETVRACVIASEAEATASPVGILMPARARRGDAWRSRRCSAAPAIIHMDGAGGPFAVLSVEARRPSRRCGLLLSGRADARAYGFPPCRFGRFSGCQSSRRVLTTGDWRGTYVF